LVDKLNKIIYGCQERDPRAQKELYELFKTKMFGICLRYAGDYNDAQDILHDGFLKVYEKISPISCNRCLLIYNGFLSQEIIGKVSGN